MAWIEFETVTVTNFWTYTSFDVGSFPVWFKMGFDSVGTGKSRILVSVVSSSVPRERYSVFRLYPEVGLSEVFPVYIPPSFGDVFRFGYKCYRDFNVNAPVVLKASYYQ